MGNLLNNVFYKFGHNSFDNPQFTWAYEIESKSENVDTTCPECGTRRQYPSGAFDVSVEGGSLFPDILGCGEYPFLIISQNVIEHWKEAGIHSFYTYPVGIAEVNSDELQNIPAPAYFRVEIDGRCKIDLEASGLRAVQHCQLCHYLDTEPSVASGFKMIVDTWDGSPIFRDFDLYPRISFCTQLVIEIARKHKHTNFRFEKMEGPFNISSRGINYLAE